MPIVDWWALQRIIRHRYVGMTKNRCIGFCVDAYPWGAIISPLGFSNNWTLADTWRRTVPHNGYSHAADRILRKRRVLISTCEAAHDVYFKPPIFLSFLSSSPPLSLLLFFSLFHGVYNISQKRRKLFQLKTSWENLDARFSFMKILYDYSLHDFFIILPTWNIGNMKPWNKFVFG